MLPTQKKQFELYLKKIRTFHQNAYILFGISALIVIGTLAFHSYPQYRKAQAYKLDIQQKEAELLEQEAALKDEEEELQKISAEYEKVVTEWKPVLDTVLPTHNPTDEIAVFLEDFSITADSDEHPMSLNTISFNAPKKGAGEDYYILPFRTTVEADEYNFKRFMKQIEKSGSLNQQDYFKQNPVPIMSIEEIQITLPEKKDIDPALEKQKNGEEEEKEIETYIFNLSMQTYFRLEEGQTLEL